MTCPICDAAHVTVTLPLADVKRLLSAVRLSGPETDKAWQRTAEVCAAAEGRAVPWQVAT